MSSPGGTTCSRCSFQLPMVCDSEIFESDITGTPAVFLGSQVLWTCACTFCLNIPYLDLHQGKALLAQDFPSGPRTCDFNTEPKNSLTSSEFTEFTRFPSHPVPTQCQQSFGFPSSITAGCDSALMFLLDHLFLLPPLGCFQNSSGDCQAMNAGIISIHSAPQTALGSEYSSSVVRTHKWDLFFKHLTQCQKRQPIKAVI